MTKNILEYLEKSAHDFPDKNCIVDEKEAISYAMLEKRARIIGSCVGKSGFHGENRPVAVLMEKSAASLVAFMGVIYSGNFYIPIDVEMPADRINVILSTLSPIAIIFHEKSRILMEKLKFQGDSFCYEEMVQREEDEAALQKIRQQAIDTDPIYALFTSGSTGVPKGVVVCHRSVIDYADWVTETFGIDETTVWGNQTPFYFSMSVLDIYSTLRSGATLYVIPKKLFMFPVKLLEYMNENRINSVYWVPSALCMVANLRALEKVTLKSLKRVLFAGEVMPTKQLNIWRRFLPNAVYANLFGPTEITDIGVYYVVDRELKDEEPIPIGNACSNVHAFFLDEEGKLVEKGDSRTGELYIRGSFLAHGYYNNPEKTKEAFVQNPLHSNYPEIVYKTGDLVRWNQQGEMVYVSRKDFQFKHMGYRIETGEIEAVISAMEGIDTCVCIYDSDKDKIVLIYQGTDVERTDILKYAKEKLPHYMIPNAIRSCESMPLNENGKINRKELSKKWDTIEM